MHGNLSANSIGRIPSLDGLRGLAVLMVLIAHYWATAAWVPHVFPGFHSYVGIILGLGGTGVDLFFVLSGFLIGGVLLDHREAPNLMPVFYLRRGLRILPIAYGSILIAMLVHQITAGGTDHGIPWWSGFSFTTNLVLAANKGWILCFITAHWSLAIEEQFYLVFPWLVRIIRTAWLPWLGPALVVLALLSRGLIVLFWPENLFACQMLPMCRADSLGVGLAAAWLVRTRSSAWLEAIRPRLWIGFLLGAIGMLGVARSSYRAPAQAALWGYSWTAAFYGCLLLLAYRPRETWLEGVFCSLPLRLYGRYSYFIYVFQLLLVGHLVGFLFTGTWIEVGMVTPWHSLAALVLILAPAAVSWHLLESPLIRLGHQWTYRQTSAP